MKRARHSAERRSRWQTAAVLAAAIALFLLFRLLLGPSAAPQQRTGDYAQYESAVVTRVLADSTERDPDSDGGWRGEQTLLADVRSGQYRGETLLTYHYVGPLYGGPLSEGDRCVLLISTYSDGTHTATVYEYDRALALGAMILVFFAAVILVGGKTGVKSLVGLVFTLLCVLLILFPALLRGAPTLPSTFALCVYVSAVCLILLSGFSKKTLCALAGTVAGTGIALLCALAAQAALRVDGLRVPDVEALLQLRQTGTPIRLTGLLAAGVQLSALGAVMDVAMSLSSAAAELRAADPDMDRRGMFRAVMNIGRDMVGTMTNTLILALFGGSFVTMLYLFSLGLSFRQLLSSAYFSVELIGALAGSVGVVLSVPLTAWIASLAFGMTRNQGGKIE